MQGAVASVEPAYSAQRRAMVDGQVRTFDVTDLNVIQAFDAVPRERFLPPELRSLAYSDAVLTLKGAAPGLERRVLLQPMHLARLIQGAVVRPTDRVLVVAGGTGYAACIMAQLAASVVTLDVNPDFAKTAAELAAELGLSGIEAVAGDLAAGHSGKAPYDIILIPGAVETNLATLFSQLSSDGRLVALGAMSGESSRRACKAIRFQRIGRDISERVLFDATAPIIAEFRSTSKFEF